MGSLILNGVYDLNLLNASRAPDVKWGADFRGRSPQFITFAQFKQIAHTLFETDKIMVIFEEETYQTVISFIDLIKKENLRAQWCLQFRDKQTAAYYQSFQFPFSWVFKPNSDWREILSLEKLESLILPVEFSEYYTDDFWEVVDRRGLEVYLHFHNFQEFFKFKNINSGVSLSVDLTQEIELSYRRPNQILYQSYLKSLNEGRAIGVNNESFTGQ